MRFISTNDTAWPSMSKSDTGRRSSKHGDINSKLLSG